LKNSLPGQQHRQCIIQQDDLSTDIKNV